MQGLVLPQESENLGVLLSDLDFRADVGFSQVFSSSV